jgi:hypothetical protein
MRYVITFKPGTDPKAALYALGLMAKVFEEIEGFWEEVYDPEPEPEPQGPAWWALIAFIGVPAVVIAAAWLIAGRIW